LCDEVQSIRPTPNERTTLTVFPTVGSFMFSEHETDSLRRSSTSIARRLAELLVGNTPNDQINLAPIPAFIPSGPEFNQKAIMAFFSSLPAYQSVFKDPDLLGRADAIVTSLGELGQSGDLGDPERGSPYLRERMRNEDGIDRLSRIAIGDIGGVFLERPDIAREDLGTIRDINSRFNGPGIADLQGCAERAVRFDRAGVIAMAHDPTKTDVVLEAVSRGLVSELVIDTTLFNSLLERFGLCTPNTLQR
jgi:hypothetical protein